MERRIAVVDASRTENRRNKRNARQGQANVRRRRIGRVKDEILRVATESADGVSACSNGPRSPNRKRILRSERRAAEGVTVNLACRRRVSASRSTTFDLVLAGLTIALPRSGRGSIGLANKFIADCAAANREVRIWILRAHGNRRRARAIQRIWRVLLITRPRPWTRRARSQRNHARVSDRLQTSALTVLTGKRGMYIIREKSRTRVLRRAWTVGVESNLVQNNGISTGAKGREVKSSGTSRRRDHTLCDDIAADIQQRNSGIVRNILRRCGRVLGSDNRIRNRVESSTVTAKVTQPVVLAATQEPRSPLNYGGALNLAGQ